MHRVLSPLIRSGWLRSAGERDVEPLPVVRDQHFVIPDISGKVFQVLPIDIAVNSTAVIKRYGRNFCLLPETCSLNIQVGNAVTKVRKEAPLFVGREAFREKKRAFMTSISTGFAFPSAPGLLHVDPVLSFFLLDAQ